MKWFAALVLPLALLALVVACGEEEEEAATATSSPAATATATATATPQATPSPEPTLTPEATPTPLATPTAEPTPTPEPSRSRYSEDDTEYKLAVIDAGGFVDLDDPSIDAYARALDAAEAKCTDKRSRLADYAVTAWQMLADEGVDVTVLQALRAIDQSIPDESPKLDCAEIAAAWVVLMTSP